MLLVGSMVNVKKLLNSPYFLWVLLALPSIPIIVNLLQGGSRGRSIAEEIVGTSGVLSSFLMIAAMAFSPLLALFPKSRTVAWFLRRRRYFGVASFSYALVHVLFYFVGLDTLAQALDDFLAPTILTGWVAFFIFIPMAITSNRVMTRAMGWSRWKMLQRGIYVAAVLVLTHWVMVEREFGPFIFFGLLALLEATRIWRTLAKRNSREKLTNAVPN